METNKALKSDHPWYTGLETVWYRLTQPSLHIQNVTKRYRARVISGLLLLIFVVQAVSILFQLLAPSDSAQPRGFVAISVTGILYFLSRTKYSDMAATLMILFFPIGITAVVLSGNSPVPEIALMSIMLSLYLGNILLSLNDLVRLGVINIGIIILLSLLVPENLPHISFIPAILTLNAIATVLIVASRRLQWRAEEERLRALRQSEERFRQLAENIQEALWIVTPGVTSIEYVSPTLEKVWDRSAQEFYEDPETFLRSIHPDDVETIIKPRLSQQEVGEPTVHEYRIIRPDGAVRWILDRGFPLRDESGKVYRVMGVARDITELKQRETALRQSEERFSKLFSANPDALFLSRLRDGLILDVNKSTESLLGYKRDELVGRSVLSLNLYASRDDRKQLVKQLQERGSLRDFEVLAQNKAGEELTLHVSTDLIELDDEPHMISAIRDVTEQKQMVAQLAYHAYILENMAEGLNYVDREGIVLFTNPAFDTMFGYEPGELVGQHISIVNDLPPSENEQLVVEILKALQDHGMWFGEVRNKKKDGTPFITWAKIQALGQGEQSHWVTFQEDITERKQTEAALRKNEVRYRTLYNNTPVMMHSIDENFNLISVSDYWLETMGYEREEVIGLPGLSFVTEESQQSLKETRPQLLATGQIKDVSCQFVKKNGEVMDILLSAVIEKDADGSSWRSQTVLVDVTKRKILEKQLRQAQKMEAIGQLTAGIAHDFNNLLTGINMTAELVKLKLTSDDPLLTKLDRVIHGSQLAANLIGQLMIFSHKQIVEPVPLDLNEVVDQINKLLRRIIGEHIDLKTIFVPELWAIKMDRSQMEQIIVNLAVNARDAMPAGGQLTIQTSNVQLTETVQTLGLLQAPLGDYVLLNVTDTGMGMSEAIQDKIFEPFFTTKGMGRGTGLGLATVYNIIKENGGDICVESEEGVGTTFKIYLPCIEAAAALPSKSENSAAMQMGSETILLVEDESSVRIAVSEILGMHGYQVLEASDGQQALNLAEHHRHEVDLLITDVVMPGFSGRVLVEQLSQSMSNLKILYMSGYDNEEISHHGVLHSGIALLQKPFNPEMLVSKVRQVLDEPISENGRSH